MRDYLLDLVEHTFDLGCIDLIKIVGDTSTTQIVGTAPDTSVIILGNFANPVAELVGTIGMPNLSKLKTLLNLQEYRENAKFDIGRKADGTPETLNIENKAGDFRNSYRFMSEAVVTQQLKTPKFAGANWDITFEPTNASIQRLKWQMSANAEEPNFNVRVENGDLKFSFGDPGTHSGSFVFQPSVGVQLKRAWAWPAKQFASIMDLVGDKTVKISDAGAMLITVDTGIAVYNYYLPAQTK